MSTNYRSRLFDTYYRTHTMQVDQDDHAKLVWFRKYAFANYLPHINRYTRESAAILDIGCNKGFLLAALDSFGFRNLYGVDLSPGDIEIAKDIVPSANIFCKDAFDYLDNYPATFDVITLKAVLEHIPKQDVIPLLEKTRTALNPGGILLVDVPNMDWLFASHERYMDFTHEVGFTYESLGQVMRNVFPKVEVLPIDHIFDDSLAVKIRKGFARFCLTKLLAWADPEGASCSIWARSIVGIGSA